MKQSTFDRLDQFFGDAPFMCGGGVGADQIESAQRTLDVVFSPEYRQFLIKYGGALVGPYPIYGLARAEPMDEHLWSVTEVTRHFRDQNWPGVERVYVISMDHAGNPIYISADGKVMTFDHDAGRLAEVAPDLDAYLHACLDGSEVKS